ncbi:MAG: glycosyltransferase family 9 protein [bacterium]|nr:glycosyltransferase family 9 protein [bacterium]
MAERKNKILIINLTRMGDILQSTPLLQALKAADPNCRISYLAVTGFADVCGFIPEIDRLIPFDYNSAVAVSKEAISQLPRRIDEIDKFIADLKSQCFDRVINLSHSKISAIICYLLGNEQTEGLTLDAEGYRLIRHPWARYFFTANLNRHYNRFNLVDVNLGLALPLGEFAGAFSGFKPPFGQVRLSFRTTPEGQAKAQKLYDAWSGKGAKIKIGFQPGASLPCKRWPVRSFVELGKLLQQSLGAGIVIFGVKSESDLAEKLNEGLSGSALDLSGKTNIETLGACLQQLDLLITNDTGTQHLAAAVGTPVISLCFGSAVSHETAPYGDKHVVIDTTLQCHPCSFQVKCKRFVCQEIVTPQAVFCAAEKMLKKDEGVMTALADRCDFDRINVWETGFDPDGFWHQKPLIPRPIKAADFINLCMREIWKELLLIGDEGGLFASPWDASVLKTYLSDYFAPDLDSMNQDMAEPLAALSFLEEVALSGSLQTEHLQRSFSGSALNNEQLKYHMTSLEEIDQRIINLGYRLPAVAHLILDFSFNKQNLQGNDPVMLLQETGRIYNRLFQLANRLNTALNSWEQLFAANTVLKESSEDVTLHSYYRTNQVNDQSAQVLEIG